MKTTDLIIAIALLACILTPAYVLYFLKYQLFANQKRHKATIDTMSNDLSKLHYAVEKIQFDEVENRLERNKQILELNEKIESSHKKHSMSRNHIDNMNVTLDYLRRTFNDDMSKVNERFELQSALHTAFVAKSEDSFEKGISLLDDKYDSSFQLLTRLKNDIDSLQSLHITTQHILKRIDSKEFAKEVLNTYFEKVGKDKLQKEEFLKLFTDGRNNREGFAKGIVDACKTQNKDVVNAEEPTTTGLEKDAIKKSPKKDSKRKITMREIETAFKEKTGLTYRGYVLKHGHKEFLKKKGNIYDSVYYQKFTKHKQQNLDAKEQMAKNK